MSTKDLVRVHYDDVEFDDQLAMVNDVPFTGVIYANYPDGSSEIEFSYVDGLPSGIQRRWYSSGQLEEEWDAVRGQGSNWSRTWFLNGAMKSERINKNNEPVRIREWNEAGQLMRDVGNDMG